VSIVRALGYPNRIVALLAPLLSPIVGAFAAWLASKWPSIPEDSLNEIFLAASIIAIAPALQFIHGRLKWDLQQDQHQALGEGRSQIAPASADMFAALGIEAPVDDVPAPDTEATADALDGSIDDLGFDDDVLADDEEDAADDVVAEEDDEFVDDLDSDLDDEDLDVLPAPTTTSGV
jgi:hypothetical protein